MNKQITELKLSDIETVVGGVYAASSLVVQQSATMYKAPTSTTWSVPSIPTKTMSAPLLP